MAGPIRRAKALSTVKLTPEMDKIIATIRKDHGDKTVVSGHDIHQPFRIPTGIFTYDYATLGGIPYSRMTMFHGPKHSGKSTAALKSIAGAQRSLPGQKPVLIDVEGTFDGTWGQKTGVSLDDLIVVQPDTGEQAVDITVGLVHARETSLIVIDSLAALLPMKEEEASAEDSLVGQQSRLITSMLRKVSAAQIKERKRGHFVSVLLINQQRSKIGGWSPTGDPLSLPGGKALGFFTSLETRWKNKEVINKDEQGNETLVHNEHAFTIEKNKMNAGMRSGDYRLLRRDDPGRGLSEGDTDDAGTMLAFAKRLGIYGGTPKQGYLLEFDDYSATYANVDAAIVDLYQDRELYDALRRHLIVDNAMRQKMPEDFLEYLRNS